MFLGAHGICPDDLGIPGSAPGTPGAAGAHDSGELGEDSSNIPRNLFPVMIKVAKGDLPFLKIYGDIDGAYFCGTEILNSKLNEVDFSLV